MAGVWVPPGKLRFVDPLTGAALIGGKVYHYIPNTDTPKDTFSDQAEFALNTNPITLDSEGECTIWGDGLYRQVVKDSLGNQLWDQITGFLGGGGGDVTFATPSQVAALTSTDTVISPYALGASGVLAGGTAGYGATKPLSDFGTLDLSGVTVGGNDAAIAAAEADTTFLHIYTPAGTLRTNRTVDQMTKGYEGDGSFILGPGAGDGAFRPPHFSYMTTKPSTWPVQGQNGFWRGDMRFSESGGEWKIIGPNVRTYDITSRYYESNTIPVASWMDVYSGNSGVNAYLTSGANIGDTVITLNGPASLEWVGKTVAFALTADGVPVDTRTVLSIAGSTITVSPGLTANYVWNPGSALTPCIFFGHRTWAGRNYHKLILAGGGDMYGHNVRMNINYVPKASEYHSFMAATGGQYGGDIYFNSDGVYGQFFESQLQGQTYDVTAIGFVSDLVRNNDTALTGGKFWAGHFMQSTGTRPVDVGIDLLGNWRNGLDTVFAAMYETSRLTVAANPGDTVFTVASTNGVHPNDTFIIGSETKTIQTFNAGAKTVTTTAAIIGTYAIGTLVTYPKGGAVLNMANTQRLVWNSSLTQNGRAGDPLGVYPTLYGNVQGDLIMESGTDINSDYWSVRFARGTTAAAPDTARIRLRTTGVNIFGTGVHTFAGTAVGLGAGCNLNMSLGQQVTWGACAVYSDGTHVYATNGSSTVTIV